MVKSNARGKTDSIPTKIGMLASSLSNKVQPTIRSLRSSKEKSRDASKSTNKITIDEPPPHHPQEEETMIAKLNHILDELRAQNAKQQEMINN